MSVKKFGGDMFDPVALDEAFNNLIDTWFVILVDDGGFGKGFMANRWLYMIDKLAEPETFPAGLV